MGGARTQFDVCLLNRYAHGRDCLAWHADREEIDPLQDAPRVSPIASVSLGASRFFGFSPKWNLRLAEHVHEAAAKLASPEPSQRAASLKELESLGFAPLRVENGSLCVMENSCQFLYKHSLLPAHDSDGLRINLTFRCRRPVPPSPRPMRLATTAGVRVTTPTGTVSEAVPVSSVEDHKRMEGWKDHFVHAFESPFVDDEARVAATRYQSWLLAQPVFCQWVCAQLEGRTLSCGEGAWDLAHAHTLATLVGGRVVPCDRLEADARSRL